MTDLAARLAARPHHDPSERWVSNPTPAPGETIEVQLDVPAASGVDEVVLRTMHDGEAAWVSGSSAPSEGGSVWRFQLPCHNPVVSYRFWCGGPQGASWLTGLGQIDHDPLDHHDFRLLTSGGTPRWVPETVWYQIFPDRFATSGAHRDAIPDWALRSDWGDPIADRPDRMRQMYGGDLDGIASHLDHLSELGVGGIYLTPVFPAGSSHRYDASTFDRIDPVLGGDDAMIRLRKACDAVGIRLMTDITLNHTGDRHEWFEIAKQDPSSVEAGFYYFTNHPDDYESWLGVRSLPKLDHGHPEVRRRLYDGPDSVVGRWLRPPWSMDGWRVDVANMTGRYGTTDLNALVRSTVRRTFTECSPEAWLLGEHWFDASADVMGDGWHGVMNYAGTTRPVLSWLGQPSSLAAMTAGPGQDPRDGVAVAAALDDVRAALPWQSVVGSMALLGSHDTARWRSMARSDELALLGLGLLMTLPGSPCLLYGDEIGLTGADNETTRRTMPWNRSDWDLEWLGAYRNWVRLRAASSALAHGGFRWVEFSRDSLTFLRESSDERLLIRAARSSGSVTVPRTAVRGSDIDRLIGAGSVEVQPDRVVLSSTEPGVTVWRSS